MNFYYLMRSALFEGLSRQEVEELMPYLHAKTATYDKGEVIYAAGQPIHKLGLILKGDVRIEHVMPWGAVEVLTIMEEGKTFGETSACVPELEILVDYIAAHDCEVLFLDVQQMLRPTEQAHPKQRVVACNLTRLLARRGLEMARRAFVLTAGSTRAKVLAYLSTAARAYGSSSFAIPYNREQLASFLGVNRSALSAELSRMQDDGLIHFHKNRFELLLPSEEYRS